MQRLDCLVFEDITPLDLVGPLQVLSRLPNIEINLIAPAAHIGAQSIVTSQINGIPFQAQAYDTITATDMLLIPGGPGIRPLLLDDDLIDWLQMIDQTTSRTISVCTGALLLAKAGLLTGRNATTHWASAPLLEELGAQYQEARIVEDGKYMMAAGVSAGIDLALALVAQLTNQDIAEAIQLSIEYDPQPPFDSGSPSKARPETIERVSKVIARYDDETA